MSQLIASGAQSIGASAAVLPMNIQGWFPLGLTGLISLLSKGLKSLLHDHNLKASVLWHLAFFMIQLSHPYITTRKAMALTIRTFVGKVMSLLSNTLFKFVIAFLPRSQHLLILWLLFKNFFSLYCMTCGILIPWPGIESPCPGSTKS